MKNLSVWLLLICFQSSVFGQIGFQFETNKKKVVIPFQLLNNLIFIPLDVNGVTLNFLLDTGVDETILLSLDDKEEVSLHSVQKIKLKGLGNNEPIEGLRSSKNIVSYQSFVDRDHELYIVLDQSFNFSSHVGIPVNGIIGYNFFKNHAVEIDYDRKKIIVYHDAKSIKKKKKKYRLAPITLERNKPYYTGKVTVDQDEISAKLLVDLGNSDALWLFENIEKGIKVPQPNFEDYLGKGFSGDIHGFRAKIKKVSIEDFSFANPIVSFPDAVSIKSVNRVADRVGSIGGEILKRFNILFDYPEQSLYIRKSSHFADDFNYNMSGIELQNEGLQWVQETMRLQTVNLDNTFDGNGDRTQGDFKYKFTLKPVFSIAGIRKNSPAEACGLQVGDLILKINGVEAYRFTLQSINDLLKSEEGKFLYFEVDRNGNKLNYKFQLKSLF